MLHKAVLGCCACILFLSGCSVTYYAEPADELTTYYQEMCVIEQPKVRKEFLEAYKRLLTNRGFTVRILPAGSLLTACSLTSDYIGKWSWDFTLYMAFAKIRIYKDGRLIGEALYEAPRAGFSMTHEIYHSTETKISGMLEKLFPPAYSVYGSPLSNTAQQPAFNNTTHNEPITTATQPKEVNEKSRQRFDPDSSHVDIFMLGQKPEQAFNIIQPFFIDSCNDPDITPNNTAVNIEKIIKKAEMLNSHAVVDVMCEDYLSVNCAKYNRCYGKYVTYQER